MQRDPVDFLWTAFYGPELFQALLDLKARIWPEHTETDPHDPVNQILRLFAYGIGHRNAVLLDHVARELYWSSLRLRSSAVALGGLIDYELDPATPARAPVVGQLLVPIAPSTQLIRDGAIFATDGTASDPAIVFELDGDAITTTDGTTGTALSVEDDGGVFSTLTWAWAPWGGTPAAGDALYVLHPDLKFTGLQITLSAGSSAITNGRWEYYDPDREAPPDSVVDLGGTIRFGILTACGQGSHASSSDPFGVELEIECLLTGEIETLTAAVGGIATTSGTLGQSTVSTNPGDYLVRCAWPVLPDVDDGTITGSTPWGGSGTVSWTLPELDSAERAWSQAEVDGNTGYAVRFRASFVTGGAGPTVSALTWSSDADWFVSWDVVQGRTVADSLGTTTSDPDQSWELTQSPFLSLESVTIGGVAWTQADNFLSAAAYDKVFTLTEDPSGAWVLELGDGTNGRIPTAGQAVVATYRIGGDQDGNVGRGEIRNDRSANPKLRTVYNHQAATGWIAQEGTTEDSLATTRAAGPASLRVLGRAVTLEDHEVLAVEWRNSAGDEVLARARAISERNGLKTVGLICVGPGGAPPTAANLAELEGYFNGDLVGLQRVGGVAMANHEVGAEAYVPRSVNYQATITVLAAYASSAKARAESALAALLRPLAVRRVLNAAGELEDAGWQWDHGDEVIEAVLSAAVIQAVPGLADLSVTATNTPLTLADDELPVVGTVAITVVSA